MRHDFCQPLRLLDYGGPRKRCEITPALPGVRDAVDRRYDL
jgi:hypothetical protein